MLKRNANKIVYIVTACIYTTIPKARPSTLYPNVFDYFLFKQTQRAWCLDNYIDPGDKMRQE